MIESNEKMAEIKADIEQLRNDPDLLNFVKIAASLPLEAWTTIKLLIAEAERGLQEEK